MTLVKIRHVTAKGKSHVRKNGKKWLRHANWLSVFFALLSSCLWFFASQEHPAAELMNAMDLQSKMDEISINLASIIYTLMDEHRLNAHAARYAGLSALFQGVSLAINQILEE